VTEDEERREKRRLYLRDYKARNHEQILAYQREYYARNREKIRAFNREYDASHPERRQPRYKGSREDRLAYQREYRTKYHRRLKEQVFAAYGNCCSCCGEDNPGFLSVDHVNGGGQAHRRAVGGTVGVWRDIVKRGFPADFQLLCYNCNLGRYFNGGDCPHRNGADLSVCV
jgi:hypothetical protein